jgi:hypothetical protein
MEPDITIHTIRDNLKNTIAGKQMLLDELAVSKKWEHGVMRDFLAVNLAELRKILDDVETCCEKWYQQVSI